MGEWVSAFGGWSSRLSATYGYGDQSFSTGVFGGYQRYHRLWGREDISRRFNPSLALAAGLDFVLSYDWAHYTNLPFPRDGRTIGATMPPTNTDLTRSLYDAAPAICVEAQWNLTPRLRIVPGLRFDYYHVVETDKFSYDPRLAVRWDLTPRLALKAAIGLYHQLPNPEFLDRQFGNPNLALPWADQYQIGVERQFTEADDADRDGVLRPPPRSAGGQHRSLLQRGSGPRVRARAAAAPQRHRALLRLARVHAVAFGGRGDAGGRRADGNERHAAQRRATCRGGRGSSIRRTT